MTFKPGKNAPIGGRDIEWRDYHDLYGIDKQGLLHNYLDNARAYHAQMLTSIPVLDGSFGKDVGHGDWSTFKKIYGSTTNGTSTAQPTGGTTAADSANAILYAYYSCFHAPRTGRTNCRPSAPVPEPLESTGVKFGEIIAWRIWRVHDKILMPFFIEKPWLPHQTMTGNPEDHGREGIWAFKQKKDAIKKLTESGIMHVYGSVKLWGKVVEHELGYRAEMASVASLDGSMYLQDEEMNELIEKYVTKPEGDTK